MAPWEGTRRGPSSLHDVAARRYASLGVVYRGPSASLFSPLSSSMVAQVEGPVAALAVGSGAYSLHPMPVAPSLTANELRELPVEQCALRLLTTLVKSSWPGPIHNRDDVIGEAVLSAGGPPGREPYRQALERNPQLSFAVSEAWAWLVSHDLLAPSPFPDPAYPDRETHAVTRLGYDLAKRSKPLDDLNARRRLGLELHGSIAVDLAPLVAVGAFDSAAFKALRTVEETVRRLAGDPRNGSGARLVGRSLMQHAFKPDGALADPSAETGEQLGLMELYAGAFGAIRNPLNHTSVAWSDPTAAAEVVLLADFLLRQLDVVAERLTTALGDTDT